MSSSLGGFMTRSKLILFPVYVNEGFPGHNFLFFTIFMVHLVMWTRYWCNSPSGYCIGLYYSYLYCLRAQGHVETWSIVCRDREVLHFMIHFISWLTSEQGSRYFGIKANKRVWEKLTITFYVNYEYYQAYISYRYINSGKQLNHLWGPHTAPESGAKVYWRPPNV